MRRNNINLYVAILLAVAIIFSFLTIYAFGEHKSDAISLSARSAVLYQPENDVFLFSKDAESRLPMASTTKIMTALIAIEQCDMSEIVEIDDSAIGVEGSSAYLKKGDVLTMEELLYALLLQSANDAAVAIACHISGDIGSFSTLMNDRARKMELSDTSFDNPHGLDSEGHYTTARDLAIIASVALKNDCFLKIVSTYKKTFATEERSRTYVNHNKLLWMYDGCIGVKTGFTKKSGRCLVAAAERDGLRFITVTLDAPSDWSDHTKMLDYGFDSLERIRLSKGFDHIYKIPVIGGINSELTVANTDDRYVIIPRNGAAVEEQIKLVRYVIAPIYRGEILGEIIYTQNGKELARVPLVSTEDMKTKSKTGLFSKILSIFD